MGQVTLKGGQLLVTRLTADWHGDEEDDCGVKRGKRKLKRNIEVLNIFRRLSIQPLEKFKGKKTEKGKLLKLVVFA